MRKRKSVVMELLRATCRGTTFIRDRRTMRSGAVIPTGIGSVISRIIVSGH